MKIKSDSKTKLPLVEIMLVVKSASLFDSDASERPSCRTNIFLFCLAAQNTAKKKKKKTRLERGHTSKSGLGLSLNRWKLWRFGGSQPFDLSGPWQ